MTDAGTIKTTEVCIQDWQDGKSYQNAFLNNRNFTPK
jgi:hypothetical protein